MPKEIEIKFDFYNKTQAAITETSSIPDKDLKDAYLALLTSYILLMVYYLEEKSQDFDAAAIYIQDLPKDFNSIRDISSGDVDNNIVLTKPKEKDPEISLITCLEYLDKDSEIHISLRYKGFWVIGSSFLFYSKKSSFLLIKHVASQYQDDQDYLAKLSRCMYLCCAAYHYKSITKENIPGLARALVNKSAETHQSVPPEAAPGVTASTESESTTYCKVCGQPAPTKFMQFRQNIGLIIVRQTIKVEGELCKACIDQLYWEMTGRTIVFGWWSMSSLLFAPAIIILNTLQWLETRKMKQPPIQLSNEEKYSIWSKVTIGAGLIAASIFVFAIIRFFMVSTPSVP